MLVLHDNDTLAHKTIELLGAKIDSGAGKSREDHQDP